MLASSHIAHLVGDDGRLADPCVEIGVRVPIDPIIRPLDFDSGFQFGGKGLRNGARLISGYNHLQSRQMVRDDHGFRCIRSFYGIEDEIHTLAMDLVDVDR